MEPLSPNNSWWPIFAQPDKLPQQLRSFSIREICAECNNIKHSVGWFTFSFLARLWYLWCCFGFGLILFVCFQRPSMLVLGSVSLLLSYVFTFALRIHSLFSCIGVRVVLFRLCWFIIMLCCCWINGSVLCLFCLFLLCLNRIILWVWRHSYVVPFPIFHSIYFDMPLLVTFVL